LGEKFLRGPVVLTELVDPMLTGKPYPIKGLVAYGIALFQSIPNPPRTREAIKNLDFYVAIDTLPQEHVMWADVVLPECTYLERYDPLFTPAEKQPYVLLRQPAVEPLYESKPGWWIAKELGTRLGLERFFPWKTYDQVLDWQLKAMGSSLEQAKKTGIVLQKGRPYLEDWEGTNKSPFGTPSGKIELWSKDCKDAGLPPLPTYEPVDPLPAGYLRLLYGRAPQHTFSRTQNNAWLSEAMPENEVWINPGVAASLGVATGARVVLENQDGVRSSPVKARVTHRIRPEAVYMVHGFGHKARGLRRASGKGASDAQLQTRYKIDPISGGSGLRVNGVRILKAAAAGTDGGSGPRAGTPAATAGDGAAAPKGGAA
jgi:thiosulfate reductase / polysulfide reductase chain A